MPSRPDQRYVVILDQAHKKKLDELAERERKTRSAVVRDAIDRMAAPVPDAEDVTD
jgi:predicted transcriptional regulator